MGFCLQAAVNISSQEQLNSYAHPHLGLQSKLAIAYAWNKLLFELLLSLADCSSCPSLVVRLIKIQPGPLAA